MQFLGTFLSQSRFQVVRNLVGINEIGVHTLSHQTGSHSIVTMSIDQGVTLNDLGSILECGVTQGLVVTFLVNLDGIVTTNHTVHQDGNAPTLTRLSDIALKHPLEGGTSLSMTITLGLLVIMSKLDDDIIARTDFLQHLLPTALVIERQRGATIDSMVVNTDRVSEVTLSFLAAVESPMMNIVVVLSCVKDTNSTSTRQAAKAREIFLARMDTDGHGRILNFINIKFQFISEPRSGIFNF